MESEERQRENEDAKEEKPYERGTPEKPRQDTKGARQGEPTKSRKDRTRKE